MTTRHLACALLLIPATLAFKPTLWFNTSFTDLDGWWNYGPQPSYWVVSELAPHGITTQGPSWHSTNRTAVQLIPAVANVALYASWARINISVEECPTTLMLAVDRRLQGPLPLWTTTTCTTGNWTLNLGRSPIADVYNATLSVYNGSATIYSVEQTVGIQTQQTDITQLLLVTIPIINSTRLNPLYSWNGDWSVSPFNDPFSGAVQTAAGGSSSSVVIPIPANTSFVLMQGVRSATNADGFVDFDPPAPYGKTIQFWSQGAAPNGMTLFSTSLDPTVLYSMTVRAGRGYIGLYYTQYISGLIDNSNWPVLNRSSTASAAVTGSTVVTSSHASTSATTSPASNSNASTNLGALIGGLVAGIIAVVAVIIITVLYRRATRRSSKPVALDPVDLADMRDEHSHLTPFTHGYGEASLTVSRQMPVDISEKQRSPQLESAAANTAASERSSQPGSHLPRSEIALPVSLQEEDAEDAALSQAAPPSYNTEWRQRQLAALEGSTTRGPLVTSPPAQHPPGAAVAGDDPRYVRGWV